MKTTYIPYMCDHAGVVAAAARNQGLSAEVLPEPDDQTLALGLSLCKGRECLPCFLTSGDFIQRSRAPDFEASRAIFFMAMSQGPCRFGQYRHLQRRILDEHGLEDVEIISPSSDNGWNGFGPRPQELRKLVWQGIVAVDLLQKLLYEIRPYELQEGSTDALYRETLARVFAVVEAGAGPRLVSLMEQGAAAFRDLPVERSQPRPVVGLVGEIYLRLNSYANQGIIRQVEAAGGEVRVAGFMEFLYYSNWHLKKRALARRRYGDFFRTALVDRYQERWEHRLSAPVNPVLRQPPEPPVGPILKRLEPLYPPALETETPITLAKAIDFSENGASGILNVLPFSCMPGIVAAAVASRLRGEIGWIPWLDVTYDAQQQTNLKTRLQVFMHQVHQFREGTVDGGTKAPPVTDPWRL
jgi:predicted nucleotide-binding protein (sugar kinase/HSP70/actin superfamily)